VGTPGVGSAYLRIGVLLLGIAQLLLYMPDQKNAESAAV